MEGSCFIKSFRWMVDEKKFKMLKWVTKYTWADYVCLSSWLSGPHLFKCLSCCITQKGEHEALVSVQSCGGGRMCGASALAAYCGMLEGRVQQQTLTLLLDFWGCIDHRSSET